MNGDGEKIPVNTWWVVKSKSGKHPEIGYPMGEVLCRNWEDIPEIIKDSGMNDPVIERYDTYKTEEK